MPDYQKTIIYKLCCKDPEVKELYVGSTCNFTKRKNEHKSRCVTETCKHFNYKVYIHMRKHGGFENWDMILVETFPCDNKLEKAKRERHWFDELGATLNYQIPSSTFSESKGRWKSNNPDYHKIYGEENKDKVKEKRQKHVDCECGSSITGWNIARHYKSEKHQLYVKNT